MTASPVMLSRYATHDASAYPGLWRGCVGAWCPGLGISGARIHDFSRRMAWATPTASAVDNWIAERGQIAYQFKNGEYATTGVNGPTGAKSISVWVRNNFAYTAGSQYQTIFGWGPVSSTQYYYLLHATDPALSGVSGFGVDVNGYSMWTAANDLLWHHVATTNNGNAHEIYVDGVLSNTRTMTTATGAGQMILGAISGGIVTSRGHFVDDIRAYDRVLNSEEIRLLARYRGIAYTPARHVIYGGEDAGGGGVAGPVLFHSHYMSQGMRP